MPGCGVRMPGRPSNPWSKRSSGSSRIWRRIRFSKRSIEGAERRVSDSGRSIRSMAPRGSFAAINMSSRSRSSCGDAWSSG